MMRKSYVKYGLTSLLLIALLNACSTPSSSCTDQNELQQVNLPIVTVYTPETQLEAHKEMESKHCPVLNMFSADYGMMRDEIRALSGEEVDFTR